MNIDEMVAGRELDALVAEKVMGWKPWEETRGEYTHVVWQRPGEREPWYGSRDWQIKVDRYKPLVKYNPQRHIEHGLSPFSRDISAAWEVVEKMCSIVGNNGDYRDVEIDINKERTVVMIDSMQDWSVTAEAPTAPLAIVRAALKAQEAT